MSTVALLMLLLGASAENKLIAKNRRCKAVDRVELASVAKGDVASCAEQTQLNPECNGDVFTVSNKNGACNCLKKQPEGTPNPCKVKKRGFSVYLAGKRDQCRCKSEFEWKGTTYTECAVTEKGGKSWCYVEGGKSCASATESKENPEDYYVEDCMDPNCECMEEFEWEGEQYDECAKTSQDGKSWCYVKGGASCSYAKESESNPGSFFKENCPDPMLAPHVADPCMVHGRDCMNCFEDVSGECMFQPKFGCLGWLNQRYQDAGWGAEMEWLSKVAKTPKTPETEGSLPETADTLVLQEACNQVGPTACINENGREWTNNQLRSKPCKYWLDLGLTCDSVWEESCPRQDHPAGKAKNKQTLAMNPKCKSLCRMDPTPCKNEFGMPWTLKALESKSCKFWTKMGLTCDSVWEDSCPGQDHPAGALLNKATLAANAKCADTCGTTPVESWPCGKTRAGKQCQKKNCCKQDYCKWQSGQCLDKAESTAPAETAKTLGESCGEVEGNCETGLECENAVCVQSDWTKVPKTECKRHKEENGQNIKIVDFAEAKSKCEELGEECTGVFDGACKGGEGTAKYQLCTNEELFTRNKKSCIWAKAE